MAKKMTKKSAAEVTAVRTVDVQDCPAIRVKSTGGDASFASGEKVQDVSISSQVSAGSDALVTSGGVGAYVGDLNALETENKEDIVGAINEVRDTFARKHVSLTGINVAIPSCMEDIDNTGISAIDFALTAAESAKYRILGLVSYEVFDADGKRINCWPVCSFTQTNGNLLRTRWMCGGTGRKTATGGTFQLLLIRK